MINSYLKIALRHFRRHRGYATINILGLAIGIACCLLILLFIRDELRYDRFHEHGSNVQRVVVTYHRPNGGQMSSPIQSYRLAPTLRNDYPQLADIVRIRPWWGMVEVGDQRHAEENMAFADEGFFTTFSFDLLSGDPRTVLRDPFSVVITPAIAEKYFQAADPIGQTMAIQHYDSTLLWKVTGIMAEMPRHSHFHFDMLMSMSTGPQIFRGIVLNNWGEGSSYTYLRLPEGMAAAEMAANFDPFIKKHFPESYQSRVSYSLQPLTDIHLYSQLRGEIEPNGDIFYIYILGAIALFVLLIATINYMNLATARSAGRAREVGLRKVMGAFRQQLIGQFLSESIITTLIAVIVAMVLAALFLPVFNDLTGKTLAFDPLGDPLIYMLFMGISLLMGIVAGSYPAFFLSAFQPVKVLKGALRSRSGKSWLRRGLVVVQFGISIVLIIATIIIYHQLNFLRNKKLGIDPHQVVVVPRPDNAYEALKTELLRDQRIAGVTASNKRPTRRLSSNLGYEAEGMDPQAAPSIKVVTVDFDFFETLDIDIVEGRSFSRDHPGDAAEGFVINQAALAEIRKNALNADDWQSPIGKRFETRTLTREAQWVPKTGQIIGVARDIHFESLHNTIEPTVFFIEPNWLNWMSIRIAGEQLPETVAFIKSTWETLVPEMPFESTFLDEDIEQLYSAEARFLETFIYFAGMAIFIACLGIFGLASYTAEQRTREIGIRKTLGATVASIVLLLSSEFTWLVVGANLIAWPLVYYFMGNWLAGFPYHVEPGWGAFLLGGLLALMIAGVSVGFQAVRAAVSDPVKALRHE